MNTSAHWPWSDMFCRQQNLNLLNGLGHLYIYPASFSELELADKTIVYIITNKIWYHSFQCSLAIERIPRNCYFMFLTFTRYLPLSLSWVETLLLSRIYDLCEMPLALHFHNQFQIYWRSIWLLHYSRKTFFIGKWTFFRIQRDINWILLILFHTACEVFNNLHLPGLHLQPKVSFGNFELITFTLEVMR